MARMKPGQIGRSLLQFSQRQSEAQTRITRKPARQQALPPAWQQSVEEPLIWPVDAPPPQFAGDDIAQDSEVAPPFTAQSPTVPSAAPSAQQPMPKARPPLRRRATPSPATNRPRTPQQLVQRQPARNAPAPRRQEPAQPAEPAALAPSKTPPDLLRILELHTARLAAENGEAPATATPEIAASQSDETAAPPRKTIRPPAATQPQPAQRREARRKTPPPPQQNMPQRPNLYRAAAQPEASFDEIPLSENLVTHEAEDLPAGDFAATPDVAYDMLDELVGSDNQDDIAEPPPPTRRDNSTPAAADHTAKRSKLRTQPPVPRSLQRQQSANLQEDNPPQTPLPDPVLPENLRPYEPESEQMDAFIDEFGEMDTIQMQPIDTLGIASPDEPLLASDDRPIRQESSSEPIEQASPPTTAQEIDAASPIQGTTQQPAHHDDLLPLYDASAEMPQATEPYEPPADWQPYMPPAKPQSRRNSYRPDSPAGSLIQEIPGFHFPEADGSVKAPDTPLPSPDARPIQRKAASEVSAEDDSPDVIEMPHTATGEAAQAEVDVSPVPAPESPSQPVPRQTPQERTRADLLQLLGLPQDTPVQNWESQASAPTPPRSNVRGEARPDFNPVPLQQALSPQMPPIQRAADSPDVAPSSTSAVDDGASEDSTSDDEPDIDKLARDVYRRLKKRLRVENERRSNKNR